MIFPLVEQVFTDIPRTSSIFRPYSVAEARQLILNIICMDLVELIDVERMSPGNIKELSRIMAYDCYSISSSTTTHFFGTCPFERQFSIALLLFTLCNNSTFFPGQFCAHRQGFSDRTSDRHLDSAEELQLVASSSSILCDGYIASPYDSKCQFPLALLFSFSFSCLVLAFDDLFVYLRSLFSFVF